MRTASSSADKLLLGAALAWTAIVAVSCLVSFDLFARDIKIGKADKGAHFVFHFIFCLLWSAYGGKAFPEVQRVRRVVLVIFSSLCFGVAIEVAQKHLTTTRSADIQDVAANTLGAIAGTACWFFVRRNKS